MQALQHPNYLETCTGLDLLKAAAEECGDWWDDDMDDEE